MNGDDRKFFDAKIGDIVNELVAVKAAVSFHNIREIELKEEVKEMANEIKKNKEVIAQVPVTMLGHFKGLACSAHAADILWLKRSFWTIMSIMGGTITGVIVVAIRGLLR